MKRLSVIVLLFFGVTALHAQHAGNSDRIASSWWFGLGGGANYWMSSDESKLSFDLERLGYQVDIELGSWLNPVWGLSLRMSAFSFQGPTYKPWGASALLTLTLDWTNISGHKPGGCHFYTPLGVGAAGSMNDSQFKVSYALSGALGLRYGFGSGKVELFGEVGARVMGANLDWSSGDNSIGLLPTLTVGMRFAMPSHRKISYIPDHQHTLEAGSEPRGLLDDMLATNEQMKLPVTIVRFPEESTTLDDNALRQLNLFVSQAEAVDWFAEFYIIGSADSPRASQRHNRKLCKSRCEAVKEALVDDFGIKDYRLVILPDGGFEEYAHQHSNQMVLIIQHTPETEEVIERWISNY